MAIILQNVKKSLEENIKKENHKKHFIFVKCTLNCHIYWIIHASAKKLLYNFIIPLLMKMFCNFIENNKTMCKRKDDCYQKIVIERLLRINTYDTSTHTSRGEKSTLCLAIFFLYLKNLHKELVA